MFTNNKEEYLKRLREIQEMERKDLLSTKPVKQQKLELVG